ncbi:MAG: HAD hydrolase family protein, partial [Ferruginibacter sp.]|nr:HAD hydrolase family protein [Ferruginibacter sp.]
LTDGSLLLLDNGEMARTMNIKDGYGLQLAVKKGYDVLIISGGNSFAVKTRLEKLGVKNVFLSVKNKNELLSKYISDNNYHVDQVLYMGDDVPDAFVMQTVGVACAPSDAVEEIKAIAHYISSTPGGKGCVRDVIEKVLKLNNDWNDTDNIASV